VPGEIESIARDPGRWPAFVLSVTEGAAAIVFLSGASRAFPGLLEGTGAPVLDCLLEVPGFVDAWRGCDDADLRRALGFRLAFLGRIDAIEVDPATASELAEQFVRESMSPLDDAESVLSRRSARRTDDRRALHREAYDATKTPSREHRDAYGAARVAVWAHTESVGDGDNDEQDTRRISRCGALHRSPPMARRASHENELSGSASFSR
jgi:hypothetical protein